MDSVMQRSRRENGSLGGFSPPHLRISDSSRSFVVVLVFLLLSTLSQFSQASASASSSSSSSLPSDGCDWIGSGLEGSAEDSSSSSSYRGSVRPVYLRCSQGSVSWLYPRGALRVVLRYGTAGKEFQGCLKLKSDFAGANVYVEQHRTLKLLHGRSANSGTHPSSELLLRPDGKRHCFESYKGQVALFMESEYGSTGGGDTLRRETAAFDYDLQLLDPELLEQAGQQKHHLNHQSSDPWQECRPCSVQETLELFCSSDFVAVGSISSLYNDALLERTLMTVRASRVIRQASEVFQPSPSSRRRRKRNVLPIPSKWRGMDGVEEDLTEDSNSLLDDDGHHFGTLHVPLTCQVKHGQGEFVFMGRQRLGDAVLQCAPRAEEWAAMVKQAQLDGSAQCRLVA